MPEPKPIDLSKTKNLDKFKSKFWKRVDQPFVGCWEWQGVRSTQGYGKIRFDGDVFPAHRMAWELLYGEIPKNKFVLHKCDNPCCVRPGHLYIGTAKDNMRDALERDRIHRRKPKQKVGHFHKITFEIAEEIRKKYADGLGSTRSLAREYNLAKITIWDIIHHNTWKEKKA